MTVQPQFFEAAAQLIPVLLIAAAVDARGWGSREPQSHAEAVSEITALCCLTVAWLVSLIAVAAGSQSGILFALVFFGLAVGWTEVVSSIAYSQMVRVKRAKITRRLRAWAVASALSPLIVAMIVGYIAV